MNNHPLLAENESKRLDVKLPLLFCIAFYSVWQLGVMLFSGETLSLGGKTPIPFYINSQIITFIVATGYILSIIFLVFFQRYSVNTAKIGVGIALLSALALYIPLSPQTFAMLFYVQAFCCTFLLSIVISVIVNLFTEKTEIKDIIVTMIFSGSLIAILQNDIIPVSYSFFQLLTVLGLAALLFFFFNLPSNVWPRYVKKADNMVKPKSFMIGLYLLVGFSCIMTLFASVVSESIKHGVSLYYLAFMVCGIIIAVLWKGLNIIPLKSASVMLPVAALGFVTAIASVFYPVLSLISCALLGSGAAVFLMSTYFGIVIAKQYPSRFNTSVIMAIGFTTVLIHSVLLEALRDNLTLLYIIYLIVAVVMVLLYAMLEPYLLYSFRGRTLQDIISVVAEEPDEDKSATEPTLIAKTDTDKPAPPLDKSLQEQRMKILLTNTLEPLTRREYQLADCILRGLRRSEIAQEMGILPVTISNYRNSIYSKFGIHSRQELFKLAETLDREWLDEDT